MNRASRWGGVAVAALCAASCSARTRRFIAYQFAGSAPAGECRAAGSARWCVYDPPGGDGGTVVYFLHYATGDERSWRRLGLSRAFFDEYRRLGRPAPRVVTISYGPYWLLTRTPGVRQTVSVDAFFTQVAEIEASLGTPTRRYVWGMSQGGYNAAVAVLSRPAGWNGMALSCPALTADSPFAAPAGDISSRAVEGRQLFNFRLAGDLAWREENPLALLGKAAPAVPLWIEANAQDEFGFVAGARALASAWREAGGEVEYVETPGGHCVIDARAVARFFAARRSP